MPGAPEVWARTVLAAVDLAKHQQLSLEGLFEGLPFDGESLHRTKRVAWDDYCTLIERIAERAGDRFEDVLEAGYHDVFPELRVLAAAVVSPKRLYWFITEITNPLMFPPVACRFEDLVGSRVRITCSLRAGARPCEPFFRGSTGGWRGLSCVLGLPPAKVTGEVSAAHGIWEIELPASHTLASRAKRAVGMAMDVVLGREHDGTPVSAHLGEARGDIDPRIADAIGMWKLTPRQADVLRHLVAGASDDAIASALGCSVAKVEQLVAQIVHRVGVASRSQLVAVFHADDWGFAT